MKNLITISILMASAASALASSLVCQIAATPVPASVNMSTQEIQSYQQKLKSECNQSLRYLNMANNFFNYGVSLENVNLYQSMRYIRRYDYERARMVNMPVPLIYQTDDNNKPIDQRTTLVWDNWMKGISQLETEKYSIAKGMSFIKDDLVRVHIGFYQYSDEVGQYAHDPMKGVFKKPTDNDGSWMLLRNQQEEVETTATFAEINNFYKRIGLIDTHRDPSIYDVLRIKPTTDKNGQPILGVYGGDTRANMEHVRNILNFMNIMLRQGILGYHMAYNDRLFTPGEVAYIVQQFYVQVHPFSEGNGRTSRFMQELILTMMGLPHGSSGDLMEIDVYSTFPSYYQTAMTKTNEVLNEMENCYQSYKQNRLKTADKIRRNSQLIDYNCRLIN